MSAPLLVVNADDFGLTRCISEGVAEAHRAGVVTSASVIAAGGGLARDLDLLRDAPTLGVGAHLTLVGALAPCLPAREVPSLVDGRGLLLPSWRHLLARALRGRLRLDEAAREVSAQIERVGAAVGALTHVDSHQHVHLLPALGEVVLERASAAGVRCVRRPRSRGARPAGLALDLLARRFERRARRGRVRTTDLCVGFDESGGFVAAQWLAAISRIDRARPRSVEVFVHPAAGDDSARRALGWRYRWEEELQVLTSPWLRARIAAAGIRLGTWRDVPA
ncbi:MAG: ChbG/HpnK family deacetylase [Polyangiales bacterium]